MEIWNSVPRHIGLKRDISEILRAEGGKWKFTHIFIIILKTAVAHLASLYILASVTRPLQGVRRPKRLLHAHRPAS
jgi:hypothetical protein